MMTNPPIDFRPRPAFLAHHEFAKGLEAEAAAHELAKGRTPTPALSETEKLAKLLAQAEQVGNEELASNLRLQYGLALEADKDQHKQAERARIAQQLAQGDN